MYLEDTTQLAGNLCNIYVFLLFMYFYSILCAVRTVLNDKSF